ncbi:MAG TPA: VWA domain-containing protein [Actinopolymorphaceae bacterium]
MTRDMPVRRLLRRFLIVLVLFALTGIPATAATGDDSGDDPGGDPGVGPGRPRATTAAPQEARPDPESERHKLVLVVDSSGSMEDPDAEGATKMEAAKRALAELIPRLPDDGHVGLRVYGATVFRASDPDACTDSQNLVPVGPVDRSALADAVARLRPYGETPLSYSLRQAAEDLGETGKRTILLVSDGEERCDPDPCATAKEISGLGIDVKVDVVGLKVSDTAREQLRCIADAGNGTFYESDDAEDLAASLERLSVRAFRPFKVDGQPVVGTTDARRAPVLGAGQYVDTAPQEREVKRYRIRRTLPNSTLHVGVSSRPAPGATLSMLQLSLTTLTDVGDGWSCGYGVGTESSFARTNPVVTASTSSLDRTGTEQGEKCNSDEELVLTVEQSGRAASEVTADLGGLPMELVVVEEPSVDRPLGLPGVAGERPPWKPMPKAKKPASVVPGASFSDAPTVRPGVFRTSLFPGEVQFYRVRLDWGQRLQAQIVAPAPPPKLAELTDYPQGIDLRLIGPTRANARTLTRDVAGRDQTFLEDDRTTEARAMTVEVRHANRMGTVKAQLAATLPGDYYVAVSLGHDIHNQTYLVPIDVVLAVEGTGGIGAPRYTDGQSLLGPGVGGSRTPPPTPAPGDPHDEPITKTERAQQTPASASALSDRLVPAGIAAAIGVVVALTVFLIRRRLRGRGVRAR